MSNIVFLDLLTMGDVANLDQLKEFGSLTTYETTSPEETSERIAEATVVITNKVFVGKAAMERAPQLKLICVAATGTNNVDQTFAAESGIEVKNVVDYSTHSVAQLTFTLILALLNQPGYYDRYVKSGAYIKSPVFTHLDRSFWQLQGKHLGIIGLGNIGKQVARIAEAFGMQVGYYSSTGRHNDATYRRLDLDELLAGSDVVSIHAPLSDQTAGLINYEKICRMKPQALLVNASRGGIIHESDLVRALDENRIAGAGLDVFEREPMAADSPLLRIQNPDKLIMTPHIGWASIEARALLVDRIGQNIREFVQKHKGTNL